MTRRKQIGPRVPPDVWEMFKDYAEEKHGKKQMASEELAEAMIAHVQCDHSSNDDSMEQFVRQLNTLNTKMDYILMTMRNIEQSGERENEPRDAF